MKKITYLLAFIGIFSIFITGCLNPNSLENEEQMINVLKRIGDENKYEDFNKITNDKQVQKVADIIENIDWENVKVDIRPPDYKFFFQFKNSNFEAKAITYDFWVNNDKDSVELAISDESKFAHLNKSDSSKLVEILIGLNLSDLKTQFDETSKKIYSTNQGAEISWANDPTQPDNLIGEDNSVVRLRVISSSDEAKFLPENEKFYVDHPYTPIEVEVIETLSGNPLSGKMTIYVEGGNVKISEVIKQLNEGDVVKRNLSTLSDEVKNTMYISYKTDYDYKMKTGKEYAVIIAKLGNDEYAVMANGYGIFEKDAYNKQTKDVTFKNVITNKKFIF
ncbi:MAG: hypothetical protein K0R71_152 [Bacillales bacterium]|jgi:hypothetical protein|nr:hypothetical protein [Bacillales bacterium]